MGYFATYTLGNLYAAQFMEAARREMPGLDDDFRAGRFAPMKGWLNANIHRHGAALPRRRTVPARHGQAARPRAADAAPAGQVRAAVRAVKSPRAQRLLPMGPPSRIPMVRKPSPRPRERRMDSNNHYEVAFASYLLARRLCYVAVDESRRSLADETPIKSLDFLVFGPEGIRLVVDIKGRRFPGGPPSRPRRVWECWSFRDDIDGLERWADLAGPDYRGLLVFAYCCTRRSNSPTTRPTCSRSAAGATCSAPSTWATTANTCASAARAGRP